MKFNQFLCGAAVCFSAALLLTSCQKETSVNAPLIESKVLTQSTGLAKDDPAVVSKVPMIMSSIFLVKQEQGSVSSARPDKGSTTSVTLPAVTITSPADGASVSGILQVAVSATSSVGIASVSLSVDGTVLKTLTAAPYNFTLDVATLTTGTHTLTATGKDTKKYESSYTITVAKNTEIIVVDPPSLPSSAVLYTPTPGNQGSEGACVAFATAYGGRSIEQYYRTGASSYSYSANIFSPEYIYDQTKVGDCGSGTSITACLDFMYNNGVTTWQTVPFSDVNGCSIVPTSLQISEAAAFKIPTYSKLLSTDQAAIKTMIVNKHAVIVGLNIDNNFTNATAGYTWNSISDGNAPHGVVVCGYDDSRNAYKILNSFGTNWGDAGYLWVDYSVFVARAGYYVYAMNY
jgi:hypothetical protein